MFSSTLLAVALTAGAPPVDPELHKKAEQLVAQLGDKDYRDRERAAKELLEMGFAAKDAVLAGQKNPDGEISDRCKKLYPAIFRHDLDKRVQKFLATPDGAIPDDLPGAARWLKVAGDGKESRELYAEMVKGHPELLLDIELHPERLKQAYVEFMRDVYSRVNVRVTGAVGRPMPTDSEVLTFLFIGAVGDVRPTTAPGVSSTYYYQFLNSTFLTTQLGKSTPFRKLFSGWLEKERYGLVVRRSLDIAAQHGVKECAPAALKLAADRGVSPTYRASALISFSKLGSKDQLKDLEPFFKDKQQIGGNIIVANAERGTVEMRDIALGAAVQLVGQNLSDFGFERKMPAGISSLSSYTYFAFTSDEKREAAHAKFKEWVEKNLKK